MYATLLDNLNAHKEFLATLAEPSTGPFLFDFPTNLDNGVLVVHVVAQDGNASDYFVHLARQAPSSCSEQRICEAQQLGQCGNFCDNALMVNWTILFGLGGVILVLWIITVSVLRLTFLHFSVWSLKTVIFFAALFDTGNDFVFLIAIYNTDFMLLRWVTIGLVAATFVGNMIAMVFIINRETNKNVLFSEWFREHYAMAAIISFFSLSNCESLTLLCIGCDVGPHIDLRTHNTPKTKGREIQTSASALRSQIRQLFSAPISAWAMRQIQLTSWIGLVLDDIGLFAIQLVRSTGRKHW